MGFLSRALLIVSLASVVLCPLAQARDEKALRIAVMENSPPMAFRDANGELTGFSVAIMRALCEEMQVVCNYQVTTLDRVIDDVAGGEVDVAAVSLLETPERRARVIFSKPYFRSISLWFAKPGVLPGQAGVRIAVVRGSAQERFARSRDWETIGVRTNGELAEPLIAGVAQATISPMNTGLNLMKMPAFRQLGLDSTVMSEPGLGGDASFGISPHRPALKEQIDAALDRIKRNGTYDRINSQFLPFRVN
ncbi:MAG TPA: transporter substrate-binding domain-containing protein [Azonexus sp.]|nr:transporter substrate-binding domain-containing protein [Azonexus sp.]